MDSRAPVHSTLPEARSAGGPTRARHALAGGLLWLLAALCGCQTGGGAEVDGYAATSSPDPASRPYVFGWPDYPEPVVSPRGGTTRGGKVVPADASDPAWSSVASAAAGRERDQAAIRALAGDYKVSFDFLETLLFDGGAQPATPYRSWGTERVFVIADEPGFVSLQHLMVMFVVDEDGITRGPFVQKHWRQDWRFEPERLFVYEGFDRFRWTSLDASARRGRWSQAVYQVDDTPRYTLLGRWRHGEGRSVWESDARYRPLPRREHTVRDDYDVMDGRHRITLLPTSWVHEQDNLKLALEAPAESRLAGRPVAREIGLARYQRLAGFDFSAGEAYWAATAPFWERVRAGFARRTARADTARIVAECEGVPVFARLFELAERLASGAADSAASLQRELDETLDCAVRPVR